MVELNRIGTCRADDDVRGVAQAPRVTESPAARPLAVSVYVLVVIVRKRLGLEVSPYQILQILSVTPFEKDANFTVQAADSQDDPPDSHNQLILFDL